MSYVDDDVRVGSLVDFSFFRQVPFFLPVYQLIDSSMMLALIVKGTYSLKTGRYGTRFTEAPITCERKQYHIDIFNNKGRGLPHARPCQPYDSLGQLFTVRQTSVKSNIQNNLTRNDFLNLYVHISDTCHANLTVSHTYTTFTKPNY